ncbi:MAG: BMP family protein [Vannielia sp.]
MMKLCVFFVGEVQDAGFNACALQGAERVAALPGAQVEILGGVPFEPQAMTDALTGAAARNDAVIFIGGQGNKVVPEIAAAHPGKAFAVVQGEVTGPNLASYEVLQEHSAFLAGCLAARMTATGTVAHLSGHRVTPGLKGRAAFCAGVRHIAPETRVLTGFCGTQDDSTVTRAWAEAQIAAGADITFTMLNAARQGAIEACRAKGTRQIGNVLDWCASDPQVFLASAIARIDLAVERAAADILSAQLPEQVQTLGLTQAAVALSIDPGLPSDITEDIAQIASAVATRALSVPTTYDGPEFSP